MAALAPSAIESYQTPLYGFMKVYCTLSSDLCSHLIQWITSGGVQGSLVVSHRVPLYLRIIHIYLRMVLRAESSSSSYLDSAAVYLSSLYLGLELLHQREGSITEAECERIGSSSSYMVDAK